MAAVNGQQTSKLEIVVHIMCTILIVHLMVVISVIVVLTKNKVQVKELHILPFHPTRLHCIKERIKKEKKGRKKVYCT